MNAFKLSLWASVLLSVSAAFAAQSPFEHRVLIKGLRTSSDVPASLSLSTSSINFGSVATNTTETRQVLVSNAGAGILNITAPPSVSGASEFAAALTNCGATLAAGAECLTEVTFSPTSVGTFNGILRVTAAVANSPQEVTLVGTAFNPVSLSSFSLPKATLNQAYGPFDFKSLLAVSNESTPDKSQAVWVLSGGTLPTGLSLNASTGVLSGTPTALTSETGASFTVTATYKNNQGQQVYTIRVGEVVLEVVQISAGDTHTCAVTTAGGAKCWGANHMGQLGNGTFSDRLTPADVSGLTTGVASIHTGSSNACAVTTAGGAKCWGANGYGQLGDGTTTIRSTPVDVIGLTSGVMSISMGSDFTCAVTTGGGAKCWGRNNSGQLGDGTTASRMTPGDVSGLSVGTVSITAGLWHACALTTAAGVKCWGFGGYGQLGDGATTNRSVPVDVSGMTSGVASITAGGEHVCALTTAGGAKCWGRNDYGQLGDGTLVQRTTSVNVSGLTSGVASISSGGYHTCAITSTGGARCWGFNNRGQLGDGTFAQRTTSVNVSGLTSGVASIKAGNYHTCVVTTAGAAKCWGENFRGKLGDNTTTNRSTATNVLP